jgi:hypothetical protein
MPCDGVLNLVRKAGALACSVAPPPDGFAGAPALPFSRPRTQLASFDQPRIILRVGPVWRALKSFEEGCDKVSASKGGEDAGDDCEDFPPGHLLRPAGVCAEVERAEVEPALRISFAEQLAAAGLDDKTKRLVRVRAVAQDDVKPVAAERYPHLPRPCNRGEKQEAHIKHANQATDECAELEGAPGDVITCGKGEDSLHAATRSSGGGKSAVLSGSLVAAASSNSFG